MKLKNLDEIIEGLRVTRESMSCDFDGLLCTPINGSQINIEIPLPDGQKVTLNVPIATLESIWAWLQDLQDGEGYE